MFLLHGEQLWYGKINEGKETSKEKILQNRKAHPKCEDTKTVIGRLHGLG
jgi:hypothetical protein